MTVETMHLYCNGLCLVKCHLNLHIDLTLHYLCRKMSWVNIRSDLDSSRKDFRMPRRNQTIESTRFNINLTRPPLSWSERTS